MKTSIIIFSILFFLTSCLKEDSSTLLLPRKIDSKSIDDFLPHSVQAQIAKKMPIYKGNTPPDIIGVYMIDPFIRDSDKEEMLYVKLQISSIDLESKSYYIKIKERNNNFIYSFNPVYVMGYDNNFTLFYIYETTQNNIYYKVLRIISGEKNNFGILNYKEAVVILKKEKDISYEFSVFYDDDNLSNNTTW